MIELLLRLALSMAVVMAVMALAARFVRRRQEAGLRGGGFGSRRTGRTMGTGGPGSVRLRAGRSGRPGAAEGGGGTSGLDGVGGASGVGGPNVPAGGPSKLATRLGNVFGAPRPRRARPIPPVEVVYRRALAKNASVAVIQATGKQFLLGVTEQSITLLAELPDAADAAGTADATDAADGTPLEADVRPSNSVPGPAGLPEATGVPAPAAGTWIGARGTVAQISDLEVWDDLEDWQQADRMPASPPDASNLERQNAWKLTLDSLRERTIRR